MALKGVKEAKKDLEARKAAAQSGGRRWLKLEDGEEVRVRFLEQDEDFKLIKVHSVKKSRNDKEFYQDVPCLDQDGDGSNNCPGCERNRENSDEAKRRDKFYVNVIVRDAPKFQRDNENKVVKDSKGNPIVEGQEDAVHIWSGGITAAEELDEADGEWKGLKSRDFILKRTGQKLDTKYRLKPAKDENDEIPKTDPMSENDQKLAEEKYDLDELTKPPAPADFFSAGGNNNSGGGGDSGGSGRVNPFERARQQREQG